MQGTRRRGGRIGWVVLLACTLSVAGCRANKKPTDTNKRPTETNTVGTRREDFGRTKDGQTVELYTLTNRNGGRRSFLTIRLPPQV